MKKKSYADMDPLEEIRAIREEISSEFESLRDLGAYLREKRPGAGASAVKSRTASPIKKAAGQRKVAKRPAHA